MFEYDQDIVEILLGDNEQFQMLYKEHNDLKTKVRDAEIGVLPIDDASLGTLKKEKLLAKDKMAAMIEQYPARPRLTDRTRCPGDRRVSCIEGSASRRRAAAEPLPSTTTRPAASGVMPCDVQAIRAWRWLHGRGWARGNRYGARQ